MFGFNDNNNYYPDIYTRVFNPDNTGSYERQISEYKARMRARGLRNVDSSAYFDKLHLNSYSYQLSINSIMRRLKHLSELSFDDQNHHHHDIVFVWDIGDLTMLTRDHIEELQSLVPDYNWSSFYFYLDRICGTCRFPRLQDSELHSIVRDVVNIEDVLNCGPGAMKEAVLMYNALKQLYIDFSGAIRKDDSIDYYDFLEKLGITNEGVDLCQTIKQHQKIFNERWKYAKKCLQLVNRRCTKSQYANVVLCEEGVPCGAAQLLLSGLSSIVPIENIYSRFRVLGESAPDRFSSIKSVFGKIQERFGEKCILIHVTSGPSYDVLFPVTRWPIRANEAIKLLYNAQRDLFLK